MLDALFNPGSIAVFGASKDPKKVGHAVLNNLIRYNFKGRLFPINPNAEDILGLKACPKASGIRENVDLAVIAIPARFVPDALLDCSDAGVKAAVIISAGFKESGAEGVRLENKIKEIGIDKGIRILGPNCLGIISTSSSINATFAAGMLSPGRLAFFSQSGALGIAILDWALGNRVGFSKFISLGNKADLSEIDFIEYFVNDPETDVILGYVEDVVDGDRFMNAARKATKIKPVILLKSGGTEAGARAASSHTGALAGSEIAFDAAFKQTGVIRAQGIEDLFETAVSFLGKRLPSGDRLLIVTNAGGPGIIAADAAERLALKLPQMTKDSIDAIVNKLPPNASLYNPVDLIGDATSERYAVVLNRAIEDPNVDGIVVILTPQAVTDVEKTAELVIGLSKKTRKPLMTSFMGALRVRDSIEKLKADSIYNFSYPEKAVRAFKRLYDYNAWRGLDEEPPPQFQADRGFVRDYIDNLLQSGKFQVGEDDAMTILSRYGFAFPARALAKTGKEASAAGLKIGFPVVMKISSPDILHKTDVGGVRVGISSRREAEDAFTEITANVKRFMPDAFINGVMVYEMVKKGREIILGVTHDRTFGHMIMFGLGGIYVEVFRDVSFRIAPVSPGEALSMVNEIKAADILKGVRGEKPVDTASIAEGILRLSAVITDFPEIEELDINPLVVFDKGAVALDARIIFKIQKEETHGSHFHSIQ